MRGLERGYRGMRVVSVLQGHPRRTQCFSFSIGIPRKWVKSWQGWLRAGVPVPARGHHFNCPSGTDERPSQPLSNCIAVRNCPVSDCGFPGFTLLELLVTIAVIALLAALIFPAISRSKGRALQAVCTSNFKQLMSAWRMYADENNGKLVAVDYRLLSTMTINTNAWVLGSMNDDTSVYPPIQPGVLDSTNLHGLTWGSLYHYTGATAIYRCPLDRSAVAGVLRVRSYSVNGWMGGTTIHGQHQFQVFHRETDITDPAPSAAFVFIDEHERSINDGWFAVDMVGNLGLLDAPATRHGDSYGLSFADGHAEVWKLLDARTKNWSTLPISNSPLNPDWQRLHLAASSLIQ